MIVTGAGQGIESRICDAAESDRDLSSLLAYSVWVTRIAAALVVLAGALLASAEAAGLSEGVMLRLDRATWIEAGNSAAESIVYVFVDMECPYCRELYSRIEGSNAQVRVRYLPVAVIQASSWGKAAAVLQARDPRAALDSQERGVRDSSAIGVIRADTRDSLELNNLLMAALNLPATPGIVYRDAAGAIHALAGVPDDALYALIFRSEQSQAKAHD